MVDTETTTSVIPEPAKVEEDTKPTPPVMKEPLTGEEDTKPAFPVSASPGDTTPATPEVKVSEPESVPVEQTPVEQSSTSGKAWWQFWKK